MGVLKNYETAPEAAERLGVDRSRALKLCREGRMPGAQKVGKGRRGMWLIPKDSWPGKARLGPSGSWEEQPRLYNPS